VEAPYGKVLKAIREDELLVATLGKNPARYKLIAFVLSASLAGAAGSLFAPFMTFIDPSSFTVSDSMILLTVVIVGGTASLGGSVAGAIVLVTLPELLRFLGIPSAAAASIRQIIYGLTLIAMMIWRPKGLCGEATLQSRS